jgi:3-oxoacyl-[acyl-carrier-protein] synthase-1
MKIYVTGLGIVSGIGIGVSENIEALRQGKHGIGKVTLFPTALDVPVSEVKHNNKELKQLLGISPQRTVSRTALLGMVAAKEALEDAGLNQRTSRYAQQPSQHIQQPPQQDSQQTQQDSQPLRIGFISATSVGGIDLSEHFYESFKENPKRGRLREVISHDCGASTELIASYLGINDFITTISTACSSAANAIMLGARMIKHGLLDAVVVGGMRFAGSH